MNVNCTPHALHMYLLRDHAVRLCFYTSSVPVTAFLFHSHQSKDYHAPMVDVEHGNEFPFDSRGLHQFFKSLVEFSTIPALREPAKMIESCGVVSMVW